MKKSRGFTLIELLVVIAIIGILASIVLVSLGGARAKARDAQRISDVKQLSLVLEMEEASVPGTDLAGCTAAGDKTTACTNAGDILTAFTILKDPTAKGTGTACDSAAAAACDYSLGIAAASTDDYEICFYLESGAGGLSAGQHRIIESGVFDPGDVATCGYTAP